MITIEIMGGLGNQLFQIFTLINISINSNIPFYFENNLKSKRDDRPFYWNNFLNSLILFLKKKEKNQIIYKEPFFEYSPLNLVFKEKHIKLYGYFQSYKYFHENRDAIFKLIKLSEKKQEILLKFPPNFFNNTISIHFRIGDYKQKQECHPVLSFEYYKKALNHLIMDTNKNDWKVLYFYEKQNICEVKEHILNLQLHFPNLLFESINTDFIDWEQMLIMSLCQHNIIANSTFSWWGSYINDNKNKVYYPNIWFGPKLNDKNTCDLFLEEWTKIK